MSVNSYSFLCCHQPERGTLNIVLPKVRCVFLLVLAVRKVTLNECRSIVSFRSVTRPLTHAPKRLHRHILFFADHLGRGRTRLHQSVQEQIPLETIQEAPAPRLSSCANSIRGRHHRKVRLSGITARFIERIVHPE